VLDPGATPTTSAILDLLRPSAFLTTSGGNLVGEGGAITSAELVSLSPRRSSTRSRRPALEQRREFQRHRPGGLVAAGQAVGERPVRRLPRHQFARRDQLGTHGHRDLHQALRGMERIVSRRRGAGHAVGLFVVQFSRSTVDRPLRGRERFGQSIRARGEQGLALDPNRFGRVVITDSSAIPASPAAYFVGYSLNVNSATVEAASAHPSISSHIGTSSLNAEITFAPRDR